MTTTADKPGMGICFLAATLLLLVSACGDSGGGGGGGGGASSPPGGSGPTWTPGVFSPASTFKNRCQFVRTGVDIEGVPFPDRPGSLLEEKFWLRSWTRETYLWNDEVADQNPAAFGDRRSYFAVLRTVATTPSGKPKDDFHFSQPTEEYLRQRNSAPRAGYGARFGAFSATRPRDYRVLYTEPGSPAAAAVGGVTNLPRGARILEVDGVDLVNGGVTQAELDILNNGLFPLTAGETHTFLVQDPGGTPRTVTLVSANLAPKPVNRTKVIDTPGGKVAYILFNTFSPFASEKDIAEAISAMQAAGVNDLVLDLRYNGGGLLAVASQLGYMVAGPSRTSGRVFERLRFNAAAGSRNPVTGAFNEPIPFLTTGVGFSLPSGAPLANLNLPRVFVLTTDWTCSASESVINALRGVFVDVILIGDTTCGKPYGFYPEDNCGETYFTIQFQGVNDLNFGDYADGFVPASSPAPFGVRAPGCLVADDLTRELGDEDEAMLSAALFYRDVGSCPPSSPSGAATPLGLRTRASPEPVGPDEGVARRSRDMTMPGEER